MMRYTVYMVLDWRGSLIDVSLTVGYLRLPALSYPPPFLLRDVYGTQGSMRVIEWTIISLVSFVLLMMWCTSLLSSASLLSRTLKVAYKYGVHAIQQFLENPSGGGRVNRNLLCTVQYRIDNPDSYFHHVRLTTLLLRVVGKWAWHLNHDKMMCGTR